MRLSRFPVAAILAFGLLALPAQAQSQQNKSQRGTTVGLGLSLTQGFAESEANTVSSSPLSISVPVTFSSFRVEPELGYSRSAYSSDYQESTQSTLLVGTGAFYLSRMEDFQFQIGARVGLRRTAVDYNQEISVQSDEWQDSQLPEDLNINSNQTSLNYSIGPAIGGEYYVSDHLSLGVEARMLYTNRDEDTVSMGTGSIVLPASSGSSDMSSSLINTEAAGYLRVHF